MAAQVLAERQAGNLTLDERLTLAQSDFVDGAGPTNWHDPGTPISIRYLMEQMITVSDNTASDMLIDRVGLEAVNQRARSMIAASGGNPADIGPISKLVEVRQGFTASCTQMHARWAEWILSPCASTRSASAGRR